VWGICMQLWWKNVTDRQCARNAIQQQKRRARHVHRAKWLQSPGYIACTRERTHCPNERSGGTRWRRKGGKGREGEGGRRVKPDEDERMLSISVMRKCSWMRSCDSDSPVRAMATR